MARVKKSRKIGQIGTPKESWAPKKPKASHEGKPKKHKGNPSGSRNSVEKSGSEGASIRQNKDPRVGSKKPISLVVEPKSNQSKVVKPKYFSPKQELSAIEESEKLAALLDLIDEGKKVSKADQHYVDVTLARHKELCDMLGISEDEEPKQADEDDPFSRFEAIDINKLK